MHTKRIAPTFCTYTTHNPLTSSEEDVMLETSAFKSLWWPIHIIINPVDKTKLSCNTSHQCSTTVFRNLPLYTRFIGSYQYLFDLYLKHTSISSSKATLNEMIQNATLWEKNPLNKDEQGCWMRGFAAFTQYQMSSHNIRWKYSVGSRLLQRQTFWQYYCPGADRLLSMNLLLTKHIHHWKRFRIVLQSTLL